MNKIFLSTLIICLSIGCNSPLEDTDSIAPEKTLQLSTSLPSIPSGAKGKTLVRARIPKEAGILDVTFSTTAGVFVQANAKTIKQLTDSLADPYRYASVTLVSDTTKGDVYITAEAKSIRKHIKIVFN
jgi:hypothetical protein